MLCVLARCAAVLAVGASATAPATAPVVLWASQGSMPNETVLVQVMTPSTPHSLCFVFVTQIARLRPHTDSRPRTTHRFSLPAAQGAWLAGATAVELKVAGTTTSVPITVGTSSDSGFQFVLPSEVPWPAVYTLVGMKTGATAGQALPFARPFGLNAPRTLWLQGDQGAQSSRAGWIRLFGTSISTMTSTSFWTISRSFLSSTPPHTRCGP